LSEDEYLNRSFYNYHTRSLHDRQDYKSSYESQIIFQHIDYMESYRRYLWAKYYTEGTQKQNELSQKLIEWIIKYLDLCMDKEVLLSPSQEEAATRIWLEYTKSFLSPDSIYNVNLGDGDVISIEMLLDE